MLVYLSLQIRGDQAKVLGLLDKPGKRSQSGQRPSKTEIKTSWKQSLLLFENLFLVLGPDVHELPGFVDLHGVVHEAVHVDELDSPLLRVVHHGRDDGQLPHLLLVVLWSTDRQSGSS